MHRIGLVVAFAALVLTACYRPVKREEEVRDTQTPQPSLPSMGLEATPPVAVQDAGPLDSALLGVPSEGMDDLVDETGRMIRDRFRAPEGFVRTAVEQDSFGQYLRYLPLKPHGARVLYHDGREKTTDVYEAVVEMDIGSRDLQQCADAAIRLRAEYLYGLGAYDRIAFHLTNGFLADYATWAGGKRIAVDGSRASWVNGGEAGDGNDRFRVYLGTVFAYAGTLSLQNEMVPVPLEDMQIGDVFIEGGSPGHCVIVVDMAEDFLTGEKLFLLAQSYMPAQEIHVLKNLDAPDRSPWYSLRFEGDLRTPEWTFGRGMLRRFP